MLTLKDLKKKIFPVSPDTQLNTRTGTVLILHEICPMNISWPDCSSDLFDLIADEHDISDLSCFVINTRGCRKYPTNIAKVIIKVQDLPDNVYTWAVFCKVEPYIHPLVTAKTAGDLDIQQNTLDPLQVALSVPHLAIPVRTAPQQYASVQTAPKNKKSSSKVFSSTNFNQRWMRSASNMA